MDAITSSLFHPTAIQISSSQNVSHNNIIIQPATISSSKNSFKDTSIQSSLADNILNKIITTTVKPPLKSSLNAKQMLSNNYAPVQELPPTEVEGVLPTCLNGAYIRNGPNPQHPPEGPYHLFDGDGMLHCLCISDNCITFCSRYVKTNKYCVEHVTGSPIFPNILSSFITGLHSTVAMGLVLMTKHLTGQYNVLNGVGGANTSVTYFGEKLFALGESDIPYQIRITTTGDIETVGRHDFNGKFGAQSTMTAHPKIDAETGETFAFRNSPLFPFLSYFRFDRSGSKQQEVPIKSMKSFVAMHDFAITKKFAVFADIQIGLSANLMHLIKGGSIVGVDPNKISRIGVIPRYATDDTEMRWFDLPGFNNMHVLNAWDEEDGIVFIAPNMSPVEHVLERMDLVHPSVEKVKVDLKRGTVTRTPISKRPLEFGVINPAFVGRKNRYGYLGVIKPNKSEVVKLEWVAGVVKLDWSSGGREVGSRMFGEGCYGGEPFFVRKGNDQPTAEADEEEDNGYLVTYVHDENSGESRFLVMDAKSPSLDIIASVRLPQRVPYGFHGLFVKESELKKMYM